MPIAVKDYTWEETEKSVYITVPLKGVKTSKVDIFSTETYVKVHYPPYLFESFLYGAVYDQKSAAQVGNGVVVFRLEKQEPALWQQLQDPQSGDKKWQIQKRQEAIERSQERSLEDKKIKDDTKRELDRFSVKQQMKLEEGDRQRIEEEKQKEKDSAMAELEKWKEHQAQMVAQHEEARRIASSVQVSTDSKEVKSNIFNSPATNEAPVRDSGVISVNFTPRTFPTPSRESTAPLEDAWLKKQAESRRIIDLENKDLSEEERDPVWLRDKGNDFFKAGNYQAAINVFSHAIRLNATLPSLYSNRAACHLKIKNYFKCIEDSSKALELLTPVVPQNALSRCKAHIRRGTAFCHLELYVEGLQDYEAGLKLDKGNEQLAKDAEKIRHIIQTSSS